MKISRLLPLFVLAATLTGCASDSNRLPILEDYLTGAFTSQEQAAADPEYFNIHLHVAPIWPARTDGPWLYVEQASADTLDKPYRQRVYHLVQIDDRHYRSDVYTLPEPTARFVGAWKPGVVSETFAPLAPADLTLKDGCSIPLFFHTCEKSFTGATEGVGCESTLRGAAYATSEVRVEDGTLSSWDRGFDAQGQQVWGAKKGGYIFIKQPPLTITPTRARH